MHKTVLSRFSRLPANSGVGLAKQQTIDGRIKSGVAALWQRYYPNYDLCPLNAIVLGMVDDTSRVLEIGCGDGRNSPDLRGRVELYAGIDPDERVMDNAKLDLAKVGMAEHLPWPDGFFDLVFHRMVAEHLHDPIAAMCETARVLRPGGTLLFETPGRWYYPMMGAAITPHRFHEFWTRRLGSGRGSEDVFPTLYRCNSRRQIGRALDAAGLKGEIQHISVPPGYLRFHRVAFLTGILFERTIERVFPPLRGKIIVKAKRA